MRIEHQHNQSLRPYEVFGLDKTEVAQMRVNAEKFKRILEDKNIAIHAIEVKADQFGEFLYLRASRRLAGQHVTMTFYGLGYHKYRERWITQEWFWSQTPPNKTDTQQHLSLEEVENQLAHRLAEIMQAPDHIPQSKEGYDFEQLAIVWGDRLALEKRKN